MTTVQARNYYFRAFMLAAAMLVVTNVNADKCKIIAKGYQTSTGNIIYFGVFTVADEDITSPYPADSSDPLWKIKYRIENISPSFANQKVMLLPYRTENLIGLTGAEVAAKVLDNAEQFTHAKIIERYNSLDPDFISNERAKIFDTTAAEVVGQERVTDSAKVKFGKKEFTFKSDGTKSEKNIP